MNLSNNNYRIAGIVVLMALLFTGGYFLGKSNTEVGPAAAILNTEDKAVSADMAPFWKAWKILDEKFAPSSTTTGAVTPENKIWSSIEGLAGAYGDPYTVFFPPKESKMFEEEIRGSFGGVGMEIGIQDESLTVVTPIKNSPAEKAGIKAGDKILTINDKPAQKFSTDEAVGMIRGEEGTQVTIIFYRPATREEFSRTLTRAVIEIPTIETVTRPDGVFVIKLYNFSAVSPNLFRNALRQFVESDADKLVLDLRGNPGGYLEAAIDMASWFLPSGKVVVTEDFGSKREPIAYRSKGYDVFNDNLKFAILVDKGSASASEILAGALQQQGKAKLIGENTFGKGSVQELVNVTDNTSLKVTVAHWLTPNGTSISNGGLKPDIEVKTTPENTANGNDPVLNRAIEYLKGL
jgi:carboxyl-terminal processing protease